MLSVFKQFGARDTVSLSGQFYRARLWLTAIYVGLLAVVLFLSSSAIYSAFAWRVERRFAPLRGRGVLVIEERVPTPAEVREDLGQALLLANTILLLVAGVASYWLAGITLRPIQAAYDRQRRFLSDASHELRTPLAILQTDLENDQARPEATAQDKERAESNLEEVQRMSRIVTDLMTLSRLDEDAAPSEPFLRLPLGKEIAAATEDMQSLADRHHVTLSVAPLPETEIPVATRQHLFLQAFRNVVKNAILYNKENGTVVVSVGTEGAYATVTVTDNGIGIPAKDLERVFDRFYRVDKSRSRATGGSGLGLPIVQSIMKKLGGSVRIVSTEDVGTSVTLLVPIHKAS